MNHEFTTELPKIKWRITDIEKAKEAKLELLDINEETTFLCINLQDIPSGLTIIEYIEMILNNGIVFVNRDEER